jgi:hypothetical protein
VSDETARAPGILLSGDIQKFFRGVVDDAIEAHGYETTEATETYVVALLADYAKPDPLTEETLNRPLTLLLDEALHATGHERFERLRSLGDGVLYVSGFFGDHLAQRGVHATYVSALGARAYDSAAQMLRHGDTEGAPNIFAELAGNFTMFVELLRNVADAFQARAARSPSAVVRVYERWLRTGSAPLARELAARGMMPTRGNGTVH